MDYPEYNVKDLENNLRQCDINIQAYEDIIAKEEDTKRELRELIRLCKERDDLLNSSNS